MNKSVAASIAVLAALALSACAVDESTGGDAGGSAVSGNDSKAESRPDYTVSQSQAIKSAQSYISMGTGYSRAGLIGQLSSAAGESFPMKDAVFAVNHIKVDWEQQAVLSAKGYLSMGGYSRQGLIDQLSSRAGEQFSVANATHAADQVGLR